jgi:hypothetical protein
LLGRSKDTVAEEAQAMQQMVLKSEKDLLGAVEEVVVL